MKTKNPPRQGVFVDEKLDKDQAGRHLYFMEAQPREWWANLAVLQP